MGAAITLGMLLVKHSTCAVAAVPLHRHFAPMLVPWSLCRSWPQNVGAKVLPLLMNETKPLDGAVPLARTLSSFSECECAVVQNSAHAGDQIS
jgi:hypothetical protein